MRIAVVGTGYVGLVMGTGLAEIGHFVACVDKDEERIANLQKGQLPLYEPGLEELVTRNMEEERLRFATDLTKAVEESLIIFLCVGTPSLPDGRADMSAVFGAAEQIGQAMTGYRIIVNKSTSPVGSSDRIREIIQGLSPHPFDVVSNPEFLKEGAAVEDFMRPDRIVVGCDDVRVVEIMREMYAPLLRTGNPFITMSIRSAEMTKYAVNTMLAARISMVNQLARIAEAYGADIGEVREGIGSDVRIGPAYLYPSLGYGGSCLPKDVVACAQLARECGAPSDMLDAIHAINEAQQDYFVRRILDYYGERIAGKRLALWGASFKARTDDLRNAPALRVIDALLAAGASVAAYDPVAGPRLKAMYGDRVTVTSRSYAALEGADGLVIATEWREFQSPDYERMGQFLKERVIFDGRNLYSPKTLAEKGFRYFSIGRPAV